MADVVLWETWSDKSQDRQKRGKLTCKLIINGSSSSKLY